MTPDTVQLNHYAQGRPDAPAVFLGSSLGTTLALWDSLADALAPDYRVVRFDTRGHGASPVPPGPYTMAGLAADVVALADALEIERFGYVGLSLGGAIGLTRALDHPGRVEALTLCCTAPRFGDPATWHERSERVTAEGMGWLVEPTLERWFPAAFREEHPDRVAPTRVIAGAEDPTAGPDVAEALADGIPGADLVVVERAAHIANVARPDRFDPAVREHLDRALRA